MPDDPTTCDLSEMFGKVVKKTRWLELWPETVELARLVTENVCLGRNYSRQSTVLIAAASLWIASKFYGDGDEAVRCEVLDVLCDDDWADPDLIRAERIVMAVLGWRLPRVAVADECATEIELDCDP